MSDSFTTSELITATQQVFKFNPLFLKLFFRETYIVYERRGFSG